LVLLQLFWFVFSGGAMTFSEIDFSHVSHAVPLAFLLSPLIGGFARWLAGFLGNWLLMGIFVLIAEVMPRVLGLGQGLISYVMGLIASASFSAFQSAFSMAGVSLPSFNDLLKGLPPQALWVGSVLRAHKIVFILVSIPIVKMLRKAMEGVAAAASKTSAVSLLRGGK
jgi:hypothetical protein